MSAASLVSTVATIDTSATDEISSSSELQEGDGAKDGSWQSLGLIAADFGLGGLKQHVRSLKPPLLRTDIDFTPRFSFRAAATFEADGKGTEGTEGMLANEGIAGMEGNESDDTFVDTFTASALRLKRLDLPFGLDGTPAIGVVDVDDESLCPEAFRFLNLRWAKTVSANIFTAMGVATECERTYPGLPRSCPLVRLGSWRRRRRKDPTLHYRAHQWLLIALDGHWRSAGSVRDGMTYRFLGDRISKKICRWGVEVEVCRLKYRCTK